MSFLSVLTLYQIKIGALVQERLTKEIAEAVLDAVHPTGVGVVVEAT